MSNNGQYGGHRDERHSDLAVLDANEYKQKRRLERILDAMDDIVEAKRQAKDEYINGHITSNGRDNMLQDAVSNAIWECWNLLRDHEHSKQERAREADEDEEIWPHSEYLIGNPDGAPIGVIEQVNNDDIVVWGLRDYFDLDELWIETWSEAARDWGGQISIAENTVQHSVPVRVSWAAALRLKEFLNDVHDMEIQFEAIPGGQAEFDYSDIIDAPTEGFNE